MAVLPPGTLLQLMYLRERLSGIPAGRFVEIGPGAGHISALLLSLGWIGTAYDLEPKTIAFLEQRFRVEIAQGRYRAVEGNWLQTTSTEKSDLVLSCMMMEHLDPTEERHFLNRAMKELSPCGKMISIVPGSPNHWGIEDDVAGHFRRYTRDYANQLFSDCRWTITHAAGLTFPISNLLLPISNCLVRRRESGKLTMSMIDRTKMSGIRAVPLKSIFPVIFKFLLNEGTLYPLHLLQKLCRNSQAALVLYFEASPLQQP